MSVHSNQKECGRSIVKAFKEDPTLAHVLLLAQTQMGKSGTYWYVILTMLFNKAFGIKDVVLMSGNREIELLEQVKQDKATYIEWFLQQDHIRKLSEVDIANIRKKAEKRIRIIWGGELMKESTVISSNTLIVWDESHYAQSKTNSPDMFFRRNGLSHIVDGTEGIGRDAPNGGIDGIGIRLITVSATPFSELVAKSENNNLKVVRLIPGDNYCGVKTYRDKKAIKPSFVINAENRDDLKSLLQYHSKENRYMLVRVSDNKSSLSIVRSLCDELNIGFKQYNSRKKDLEISDLSEAPSQPTLVLVSGMLRMGKVVPKEHVEMVFEASTKNNKRPTDTGLQGLLGRMCGYTDRPGGFDVTIYVEENLIGYLDDYIETYDSDQGPMVGNAMNVKESVPLVKTVKSYHLVKLPSNDVLVTKKGNPKRKVVEEWLKNEQNLDDLQDVEKDIKEKLKGMLKESNTQLKCGNTETDANGGIRRMIDRCVSESQNTQGAYRTIEPNVLTMLSYPSTETMWLVFRNRDIEPFSKDQESGAKTNKYFYVLDKCVFKQK